MLTMISTFCLHWFFSTLTVNLPKNKFTEINMDNSPDKTVCIKQTINKHTKKGGLGIL